MAEPWRLDTKKEADDMVMSRDTGIHPIKQLNDMPGFMKNSILKMVMNSVFAS